MNRVPIELETFHHVYNRGTDKRIIFLDDADRKLFLRFCYLLNDQKVVSPSRLGPAFDLESDDSRERLVYIVAFCLMDNHFHFLLYERTEGGIAKFMLRLGTAYAHYFNEKYERTGTLFQGPYKNKEVSDEAYLMSLIDYLHLNPISHKKDGEKELVRSLKDLSFVDAYKWSSYQNYCGQSVYGKILNKDILKEYFELPKEYKHWLCSQHDFLEIADLMLD